MKTQRLNRKQLRRLIESQLDEQPSDEPDFGHWADVTADAFLDWLEGQDASSLAGEIDMRVGDDGSYPARIEDIEYFAGIAAGKLMETLASSESSANALQEFFTQVISQAMRSGMQ